MCVCYERDNVIFVIKWVGKLVNFKLVRQIKEKKCFNFLILFTCMALSTSTLSISRLYQQLNSSFEFCLWKEFRRTNLI